MFSNLFKIKIIPFLVQLSKNLIDCDLGSGLHSSIFTKVGSTIESPIMIPSPSFKVANESVTPPNESGNNFLYNFGHRDWLNAL